MSKSANASKLNYRATIDRNFPAIQYHFVEMMTDHLADCSREFKGDLQQMIILALMGQVLIEHYRKNDGKVEDLRGISTSRLSDLTGISRQTIRRKLKLLAKNGWIESTALGSWRLVTHNGLSQAGRDLSDLSNRNRDRIAKFLSAIMPIMEPK